MSDNVPIPTEFAEIAAICVASEGMIGDRTCLTVDARELHAGLGVGRDLSTWIEGRIKKYGFREGVDFEILLPKSGEQTGSDGLSPQTGEKSKIGRPTQDRRLTLDMAKELSMVENNERGRLAEVLLLVLQLLLQLSNQLLGLLQLLLKSRSLRIVGRGLQAVGNFRRQREWR